MGCNVPNNHSDDRGHTSKNEYTLKIRQPHRLPSRTPGAGLVVKMPGTDGAAARAFIFVFEVVRAQLIPVPFDQDFATSVAIGAGTSGVVDVAGVHVTQSFG